MPIQFVCPHCGKETLVGDQFAGQSGPCGSCGQMITVPTLAGQPATGRGSGTKTVVIVLASLAMVGLLFCGGLVLILYPAIGRARGAAQRASCSNNLKMVALALHNYHDVHNRFPPAFTVDKAGQPLHSWRTLILPYLGHAAELELVNLEQPWDSAENQASFASMFIPYYRCPSTAQTQIDLTNYVVVTGPGTIFDNPRGRQLNEILDGTSNTVMVVEVEGLNIPWMKPQDIDIAEFTGSKTGATVASSKHPAVFMVAMADGSVRQVRTTLSPRELQAIVTRAGREVIDTAQLAP